MRSFLALGFVSLVAGAGMIACGDDSSDDPTPTVGGSGGTGGGGAGGTPSGGNAGTANGGSAGTTAGGTGGTGGVAQPPAANCTGCVQLSVGLTVPPPTGATNNQAGYIFEAAGAAVPFDLTDVATITWRVQALTTNAAYYVQPYLQNAPPEDPNYAFGYYASPQVALAPAAFSPGTWVDVTLDVAAIGAGAGADAGDAGVVPDPVPVADAGDGGVALLTAFDKSVVRRVGLYVGAPPAAGAGLISVEVDSVTVVGSSNFTSKTFDAGLETLGLDNYLIPTGTLPPAFR